MGSRAHVSVFLVEGLSQVLGTSYHRPAGGTPTTATAAGTQMSRMPVMTVGMTRMGCRTYYLALPILMHRIGHHPLLMVSRVSSRWLNIFMLVLGSLPRPGHSFVRAGRVHDMLLLEVRMRTTRSHILIGRWLFASWRVTRMWSKVLDTGLWLCCNVHHVTFRLHLRQQPLLL